MYRVAKINRTFNSIFFTFLLNDIYTFRKEVTY